MGVVMGAKCFMIKPSGECVVEVSASAPGCAVGWNGDGQHCYEAEIFRGSEVEAKRFYEVTENVWKKFQGKCRYCNQTGPLLSPSSAGMGTMWIREDTGEIKRRIAEFPAGAMWYATWMYSESNKAADGRQIYGWDWENQFDPPLMVKTPGGDWDIDSRASNCTMPNDRTHRCWVRHGTPPNLTVDKQGKTCGAGAGSIISGNYHGFLRGGSFT